MASRPQIEFPPFRLDLGNQCLWHGDQAIALKPKDFAVLHCLVDHPGQLVTKEELLDTVWPGTTVSEGVLKVCVRRIRRALGDPATAPQFIETVHRRGYRFIAPLSLRSRFEVQSSRFKVQGSKFPPILRLVGRESELQQLHSWLDQAQAGSRQVVFVTGEVGIGKTTIVESFAAQAEELTQVWVGQGQCIEQHGAGEAYMPVLEALERLCRRPDGQRFVTILDQHAPTWLAQLPSLLDPPALEALQRRIQGVTRERMLREMVKALETLTHEVTLVLVLEDLQWSDYSTLALLSLLAQRQELARLFVLGSYRPADISGGDQPLSALVHELHLHGQCRELSLRFLSQAAVQEYVARRFPGELDFCTQLASLVYTRTDGNPLFFSSLLDYFVAHGLLAERTGEGESHNPSDSLAALSDIADKPVPDSLRQMIEKLVDRLSADEQRILEVASVAGVEFSAAALARSFEEAVHIEECCEGLARRGKFLESNGWNEWPDGTVAGRYRFIHSLYQNVLYRRISAGRRVQLHRLIGERQECGYGDRAWAIAAELAIHFEQGRLFSRAVTYLQAAAENALRRRACQEAIRQLSRGLEVLRNQSQRQEPADPLEPLQQELSLQLTLSVPLAMTKGYAAPEVEAAYRRARDLCKDVGETPQLFRALRGLRAVALIRGQFDTARRLGEQLLGLAEAQHDAAFLLSAHAALGVTRFHLGEFRQAHSHLEHGLAAYDPHKRRLDGFVQDPGVACLSYRAFCSSILGYFRQAEGSLQQALSLARELMHPHSLAYALSCAAVVAQLCRDERAVHTFAEETLGLSDEHGFAYWHALGMILQGWSRVPGEAGIEDMLNGLTAWRATGAEAMRPYYLALLADASMKTGRAEDGLGIVDEALGIVRKTEERFCEAELYRLRGECLLAQEIKSQRAKVKRQKSESGQDAAEACFMRAINIARRQQAKLWELRAVVSLGRLWLTQGKQLEARQILEKTTCWFDKEKEGSDLREARELLDRHSS